MNFIYSLSALLILALLAWAGTLWDGLRYFFAVIIPCSSLALGTAGVVYRVVRWARSPVPFRISLTAGQQRSLPWIKPASLENPHNTAGVWGRMLLEVLFFRSLFRNTKFEMGKGPWLAYGSSKFLWLGAMLFHWSMLVIVIRHLRFFAEPVPVPALFLQGIDGLFDAGVPPIYITDLLVTASLLYLLVRRLAVPVVRYISLAADYFPLLLILAVTSTGILMRYFFRVDLFAVKQLTAGLARFAPVVPEGAGTLFYLHIFLVSILVAYAPFSKIVHFAGVFLSPTRNRAGASRMTRHINTWDYPVKGHTYEEWEAEFRDKLKSAGFGTEKE